MRKVGIGVAFASLLTVWMVVMTRLRRRERLSPTGHSGFSSDRLYPLRLVASRSADAVRLTADRFVPAIC